MHSKRAVPAKQFVGPLTVEEDRYTRSMRQAHNAPLCKYAGRLERLVLVPDHIIQLTPKIRGARSDVVRRRVSMANHFSDVAFLVPGTGTVIDRTERVLRLAENTGGRVAITLPGTTNSCDD